MIFLGLMFLGHVLPGGWMLRLDEKLHEEKISSDFIVSAAPVVFSPFFVLFGVVLYRFRSDFAGTGSDIGPLKISSGLCLVLF